MGAKMNIANLQSFEPIIFAKRAETCQIDVAVGSMTRLALMSLDDKRLVSVKLQGGTDKSGYLFIKCDLAMTLSLSCQRCLNPFDYPLVIQKFFYPVSSENIAKNLPKLYEALIVNDKMLDFLELLEEEILLQLPIAQMHEYADCPISLPYEIKSKGSEVKHNYTNNPFQKLKILKDDKT